MHVRVCVHVIERVGVCGGARAYTRVGVCVGRLCVDGVCGESSACVGVYVCAGARMRAHLTRNRMFTRSPVCAHACVRMCASVARVCVRV